MPVEEQRKSPESTLEQAESRALLDPVAVSVSQTTSQTWLQQEATLIREASELAVPASEIGLANAYWNGRREGFNSAREDVLAHFPDRSRDLPDAIQVDEVRVRQLVIEQEQAIDKSVVVAR